MELAIDTSSASASVGLTTEGKPLAEITWQAGQRHSATLLPQIQHLLDLQRVAMSDLTAIAVALGPGSFNGLRTGLGTAKGLCFALDIPLIGVGTLEVAAYPFSVTGRPICPLQEAGRGEVAAAVFQESAAGLRCLAPPQLIAASELPAWAPHETLFCGDVSPSLADQLRLLRGIDAVVTGAVAQRRASVLAELAWRRLESGQVEDLDSIEPLYLRRPAISQPRVPIRQPEA